MMDLLIHPVIKNAMAERHYQLLDDALQFFTNQNIAKWLKPNGYLEKTIWQHMAKHGFIGASIEKKFGGQGHGLIGDIVMCHALAQLNNAGLSMAFHVQNNVGVNWIQASNNNYLKENYLPRIASGELLSCTCYTEFDQLSPTQIHKEANNYFLTGKKAFIINGYCADVCTVTGFLDGVQVAVLVEKNQPGVVVEKVIERFGYGMVEQVIFSFNKVEIHPNHFIATNNVNSMMLWNHAMTHSRFSVTIDNYLMHKKILDGLLVFGETKIVNNRKLFEWPLNQQVIIKAITHHHAMTAGIISLYKKMQNQMAPAVEAARLKWYAVKVVNELALHATELEGAMGITMEGRFLNYLAQAMAFRMASGCQAILGDIFSRQLQQKNDFYNIK